MKLEVMGNEAKLILNLANARAEEKVDVVYKDNHNSDYYAGFRDAKNWIFADLAQICMDLEQGTRR